MHQAMAIYIKPISRQLSDKEVMRQTVIGYKSVSHHKCMKTVLANASIVCRVLPLFYLSTYGILSAVSLSEAAQCTPKSIPNIIEHLIF